jgi:hypothetical protein
MEKVPLLLKCPSNLTLMKRDCHALPRRRTRKKIPKTKSLLTSPAYRQAGFTKGRNYPSLAIFFLSHRQARGARGDFLKHIFSSRCPKSLDPGTSSGPGSK